MELCHIRLPLNAYRDEIYYSISSPSKGIIFYERFRFCQFLAATFSWNLDEVAKSHHQELFCLSAYKGILTQKIKVATDTSCPLQPSKTFVENM